MTNPVIEGDGAPLVLIHGIGASHRTWDGVVAGMKDSFLCIRYDLRGHGETTPPAYPWNLQDFVADVEILRREAGAQKIHIAGHSLGAMIAAAYARNFPKRVLSLSLLSTAAGRSDEDSKKVLAVVEKMEKEGVAPVLDMLVHRWFSDDFMNRHAAVVESRKQQVLATEPQVFCHVFRLYAETEMAPWLKEIKVPTLVLTGEQDGGCNPRLNRFIADQLPNSTLVILPGLKHAVLLEAPQKVCAKLKEFLGGVG